MEIKIIKETIALSKDETLIEKSGRTYTVSFLFDPTWEGFEKTASFRAGSTVLQRALTDDKCVIPAGCLRSGGVMLYISVQGTLGRETKQTPWCLTSRVLYPISSGSSSGTGPVITPTGEAGRLWEELEDALSNYTEDELKERSLIDIVDEMDEYDNTATDEEVSDVLNDVWGSDEKP